MRISDWSSDVCSSDLARLGVAGTQPFHHAPHPAGAFATRGALAATLVLVEMRDATDRADDVGRLVHHDHRRGAETRAERFQPVERSEEQTSELQSLMRISYAVFCLKKKN